MSEENQEANGFVLVDVKSCSAWSNEEGWIDPESDIGNAITVFSAEEILNIGRFRGDDISQRWVQARMADDTAALVVPAEHRAIRAVVDSDLTAEQLDDKYNPEGDGEHPDFTRDDWRNEVANEDTIFGYWMWLKSELACAEDEVLNRAAEAISAARDQRDAPPAPGG